MMRKSHARDVTHIAIPLHSVDFHHAVAIGVIMCCVGGLTGCGFSLNSPVASNSSSSYTDIPGGQVVPVPQLKQQLTGCTNPNTGTPTNDWGSGSNPVYVNVWNVIVGDPVYATNSIFWMSRESEPGKSILLTGAFTAAAKQVRIAAIPTGTLDWQSIVKASTTVVFPVQQTPTYLTISVPTGFPKGVYGFQIEDPVAPPLLAQANVPAVSWAIGVPAIVDANAALQHQVYDCGVEPGGVLRLFGKNFQASQLAIVQASDGSIVTLMPSKVDTNSMAITVPADLAPGAYSLWVGSSPWDSTSSASIPITVEPPPDLLGPRHVSCSLIRDGVSDNTKRLQTCLDTYAPIPGSRELVYIELPEGRFILQQPISARPYEILAGASSQLTHLVGQPSGMIPDTWINVPQYFGLAHLSFEAPAGHSLVQSVGTGDGNPKTSGHLFVDDINFSSTPGPYNGGEQMFLVAGPDIQVYDSTFLSNANQDFDILFGDGAIISGNHFTFNNWTGSAIGDSQNIIFEKNLTDSQNPLGQGLDGLSGGSGLSITRGNGLYGPSALSRDVYVGYNTFTNTGSNPQQVLVNDGDGGSYYGPIAGSTSDSVVLAGDPWWAWMGTTNPEAASMSIVSGTGVGQHAFLKSYSGRNVQLETPWIVQPDSTSIVAITQYEGNMTWANNTFRNTLGGSMVLADSLDAVIEDNLQVNAGAGILLSAFGPYGGPASYGPVMGTDVLRNTSEVGDGNYISYNPDSNYAGIGIQDMPGCLVSGMMIRDNVVPSRNTIFSTNGVNGINGVVIEQNKADLFFQWLPPGFLIQNNSLPADQ